MEAIINNNQKKSDTRPGDTSEPESFARLSMNPHLAHQANTPGIKIGIRHIARIIKEASSLASSSR